MVRAMGALLISSLAPAASVQTLKARVAKKFAQVLRCIRKHSKENDDPNRDLHGDNGRCT
jgi:hypothetical protein